MRGLKFAIGLAVLSAVSSVATAQNALDGRWGGQGRATGPADCVRFAEFQVTITGGAIAGLVEWYNDSAQPRTSAELTGTVRPDGTLTWTANATQVSLGAGTHRDGKFDVTHRTDRCSYSVELKRR